ncbi:MAG TPA: polynucleotide adenylyltransferase [Planctomycetota bacterium]|jgi:tRNA nucleotidyltransferase (CCA-adding enzyme)|nr:polynucleotide adenylyltransferase [Planctomycetota bacterium]MDP7246199.1 polynucleotide adenylyltransferase [Planctomycetota bacterium]HJM40573.1 polynucleotide adenylyltransferase [Planctomycetota bacterium]|tara:strand:- start:9482 stop:10873 length:1392 start_codon:yes stop_codon:yes gene_type:complete
MVANLPAFADPGLGDLVGKIATACKKAEGQAFLVGGAVRDSLLGLPPKDADLEVYGLDSEILEKTILPFGKVHCVGQQFAVLHLATDSGEIEISLPRRESKTGPGHKGFSIQADPNMKPEEASSRRDFTVNAMLMDPLTGEIVDPFHGQRDLKLGLLRHVSSAFSEDPLRVLRAARFVARFGWAVAPETVSLCWEQDLSELPVERYEKEWRGLLLRGAFPGLGLQCLANLGALRWFPELDAMRGIPQDPVWHPEGDVFRHTCLCLNAGATIREEMEDPWVEMLGILCHDLGKAETTSFARGRWRSPNHDNLGAKRSHKFFKRISNQEGVAGKVAALAQDHLRPTQYFFAPKVGDGAIRRLALRVEIPALVRVAWSDAAGRDCHNMPSWQEWEPGRWLLNRAADLGVKDSEPKPYLQGQDLLDMGLEPGPEIGKILSEAFELQLDGKLPDREASLDWLKQKCSR